MRLKEKSVRNALLGWVLLIGVILFLLGGIYTYQLISEQVYREFTLQSREAITHIQSSIKQGITEPAFEDVRQLALDSRTLELADAIAEENVGDPKRLNPELYQHLDAFVRTHKNTLGVGIGTTRGGYLEYPAFFSESGYDPRNRSWYKEAVLQQGEPYITGPYVRATGELTVAVAHSLLRGTVEKGVIVFGWDIQDLAKEVGKMKIGWSGYITVLSRDDKIVVYPGHSDWLLLTPREVGLQELMELDKNGHNFKRVKIEGSEQLIWSAVDQKTGWKVVAIIEEGEIEQRIVALLWPILVLYWLTLAFVLVLICFIVQKKVVVPINQIKEGAREIAAGNLAARVLVPERNEFGTLADTFNEMAGRLQANFTEIKLANQELSKREREFKSLVENVQDVILRIDKERRVVYINPVIALYVGFEAKEMTGLRLDEVGVPELFLQAINGILEDNIQGRVCTNRNVDFEVESVDKTMLYLQAEIIPEFDDMGRLETILTVIRNLTQQKMMEKQLLRLDRLNTIGEMAAGIAHEVRNPMTTVRGFLQMMAIKENDEKKLSFYELMIEELDRANGIITEFLSLAKNKPLCLKKDNLNDIIKAIAPLLKADAAVSSKSIELLLGDVPDLLIDEKEIRQLLINMARNAIEAMQEKGRLTIKTYCEADETVLEIKDEGCGITQEILDNIGMPFHTTKASGTGLGLAVCYSIAERHKAKINVATSAAGTSFFIRFKSPPDVAEGVSL